MNKKQKKYTISSVLVIAAAVVAYILFSGKTLCKSIRIEIEKNAEQNLINENDIKQIILSEYKNIIGSPVDDVNLGLLERKIEMLPSVKNADVYKSIDGILGVKIEQRNPILRIFPEENKGFYIDDEGELMPLSETGTIRVLTANGNIKDIYDGGIVKINSDTLISETLKDLYMLAKFINEDKFFKAQFQQIYVNSKTEFELIPTFGNQIVILGDIYDYKKKLQHLKMFYTEYLRHHEWEKYKTINLKYKKQIVCEKRN